MMAKAVTDRAQCETTMPPIYGSLIQLTDMWRLLKFGCTSLRIQKWMMDRRRKTEHYFLHRLELVCKKSNGTSKYWSRSLNGVARPGTRLVRVLPRSARSENEPSALQSTCNLPLATVKEEEHTDVHETGNSLRSAAMATTNDTICSVINKSANAPMFFSLQPWPLWSFPMFLKGLPWKGTPLCSAFWCSHASTEKVDGATSVIFMRDDQRCVSCSAIHSFILLFWSSCNSLPVHQPTPLPRQSQMIHVSTSSPHESPQVNSRGHSLSRLSITPLRRGFIGSVRSLGNMDGIIPQLIQSIRS